MDPNTPVPNIGKVQVGRHDRLERPAQTVAQSPVPPPAKTDLPPLARMKPRRRRSPRWVIWLIGFMLAVVLLAMLACALVGGLIMGIAIKLANEVSASATTTQTFAVVGIPSLVIHNAAGNLSVRTGTPGSVGIEITRNARDTSQSAAQADLDKIAVTATQDGDQISVTSEFQDESFLATSSSVDLRITVPPNANIAADVTAGNLRVDGVSGVIELTGGAGEATLRDVSLSDGSRIHLATGSVTMQGAIARDASVDIAVNTGNVTLRLPATSSARLDARTNAGAIRVTGWRVQPTPTNHIGSMTNNVLGTQPTATIHIRVESGDIAVSQF